MVKPVVAALSTVLVAACSDAKQEFDPFMSPPLAKVMTYNVYLGADESPILTAATDQIPIVAAQVWATVQHTNFPERAGKLAELIAAANPDLVGLQEVVTFRVQSPGDAVIGGTTPATTVRYDFLQTLLDSLTARGADYTAVANVTTSDVEVPVLTGADNLGNPTFDDVRLTDGDAILVKNGVAYANVQGAKFVHNLDVPLAGQTVTIARGWGSVDATIAGTTFRFINTHLLDYSADIQVLQAQELLAGPAKTSLPVILVGDLNTTPTGATPTYGLLADSGFADSWLQAWPNLLGNTSGQASDLSNPPYALAARIDFVLSRDPGTLTTRAFAAVEHAEVHGAAASDRTASGLWPSDHAGYDVVFQLRRR